MENQIERAWKMIWKPEFMPIVETWETGVYTDCRVGKPEQLRTIRDPVFHVLFVYLPSAPGSRRQLSRFHCRLHHAGHIQLHGPTADVSGLHSGRGIAGQTMYGLWLSF